MIHELGGLGVNAIVAAEMPPLPEDVRASLEQTASGL
jgi:hypothetical protein